MALGNILVADDDAAIRTVLNQALSRAGYDVRITSNAATLWRWVSAGEGDIVVTDVVMPDENAFDLLPRIKKARPDLPVLVMSAKNTMMTAITAAERGAYEYLPKPFDLNDLIRLTGRAIEDSRRQRAGHRPAVSEVAGDNLPIVGPTRWRNLWVDSGHGHMGWTWACGTGRILADLIGAKRPEYDPEVLRYGR